VVAKLGGWQVAALGELLDAFDLPRPSEGNKEHKITRIVEFLETPHKASDKDLAALVRNQGCLFVVDRNVVQGAVQLCFMWWYYCGSSWSSHTKHQTRT
jgi:hypothetical protein